VSEENPKGAWIMCMVLLGLAMAWGWGNNMPGCREVQLPIFFWVIMDFGANCR